MLAAPKMPNLIPSLFFSTVNGLKAVKTRFIKDIILSYIVSRPVDSCDATAKEVDSQRMFAIQSARFSGRCYVNATRVHLWEKDVSDRKEIQCLFQFGGRSV